MPGPTSFFYSGVFVSPELQAMAGGNIVSPVGDVFLLGDYVETQSIPWQD